MSVRARSVESCTRAIREKNQRIRAVLSVLREPDSDAAARHDAPLAGVPYVLKDCWDTAGVHTTGGSWRHRDRVPIASGPLHRALRDAGAVMLGKSNLSDLCFSPESDNHLFGPVANPFDETRTAGGSTGGGAAAVATGMASFDWGGDFGGSIRIPAGACGVAGLRLSQAAWPGSREQFPKLADLFASFLGYGPIAETVEGCRQVMEALAGDLRASVGEEAPPRDRALIYAPDARCTGAWPTFVADAAHALARAGVRFEIDRDIPPPSFVNDTYNGYLSAHLDEFGSTGEIEESEALRAVALALASRGKLDLRVHPNTAILLALVKIGSLTLFRDRRPSIARVARVREGMQRAWSKGLVVAPTTTVLPPKHGRAAFAWTWQAFAKLGNLTDSTSIAVPFGRFAGGLPRSIQVLGPPGSERAVLDLAAKLEAVAPER